MRSPSLWLYLLGAITVLVIALRRVRHRILPLSDQVFSRQVAIDHVHSAVCWARADGSISGVNPALANMLGATQRELLGSPWTRLFPAAERDRLEESYRQALLMGTISLQAQAQRLDGSRAQVDILLVTMHDHKARLIGHYCLMEDRTRVMELEQQVQRLKAELEAHRHSAEPAASR